MTEVHQGQLTGIDTMTDKSRVLQESLTPVEVAAALSVSVATVRELLNSKRLKGYRIRKAWRVRREDLDEFMAGGQNAEE